MPTPVREARDDFPPAHAVCGGRQEGTVPLRLAHYPPVITCFRGFLGAHGSERATAAGELSRHAHTAARLGTALDIGEYTPYAMQHCCIEHLTGAIQEKIAELTGKQ